jgi:hypothetical protein
MSIKKRIAFFAIGLLIGIVFVNIILDKKGLSLTDYFNDYMPDGRVLNTLQTKQRVFDESAYNFFINQNIDTSLVEIVLKEGNVNFSESHQREKPCNFYQIEKELKDNNIGIYVKNCDSLVTIQKAFKINAK